MTLQFNIVKRKESGVKSFLTKLTLFKRSIEARRLGRTIHDLRFTINNPLRKEAVLDPSSLCSSG
jgi:hypothetical protein